MLQGKKVFSQNDEDGAIESVFREVGTTDKVREESGASHQVYVEFGVESCRECNSRHLRWQPGSSSGARENLGWDAANSLLMDGGNYAPKINLRKVVP